MAPSREASLRVSYLANAAQYLLDSSPSSSASMVAERLELMENAGISIDGSKQSNICLACGTRLIPGLTSQTTIHSKRRDYDRTTGNAKPYMKSSTPLDASWQEECLMCQRSVKTGLSKQAPIRTKNRLDSRVQDTVRDSTASLQTDIKKDTQTPHRKRKKYRGLLSRSKDEEDCGDSTLDLNLMDFMKAV